MASAFSAVAFLPVLALLWPAETFGAEMKPCAADGEVVCPCGSSKVRIPIKMCKGKPSEPCFPCNKTLASTNICESLKECKTCDPKTLTCLSCFEGYSGKHCENTDEAPEKENGDLQLHDGKKYFEFYVRVGEDVKDHVWKRDLKHCEKPDGLNTAEIHCIVREDSITCSQMCIWGTELPDHSMTQTYECDDKTGTWSPSGGPRECEPYVNCNIRYTGTQTASKSCYGNFRDAATYCMLSCGDKEKSKYTCNLDSTWYPPLPDCFEPGD